MKKLQILTLCAAILLGGVYLTNAINLKKAEPVSANNDVFGELSVTGITDGVNVDVNEMTGANTHNTATTDVCDFNNDGEINVADINRFNAHCSVVNGRDSNKCDFNKDGEFNIADINVFNYTCYDKILGTESNVEEPEDEYEICDFDENGKINIDDITRFIGECMNGDGKDKKCDLNGNGKYDIEDLMTFNDVCYNEVLGTDSNVVEPEKEGEMCDFNNDGEINIADVSRFNTHCSVTNGRDSNKCDLNKDGEVNIADMNVFNDVCYKKILGGNSENGSSFSGNNRRDNIKNKWSDDLVLAHEFAYLNGITTIENIERAKMYSPLTRIQMAKMLSNYAINVLGLEPDTSKGMVNFVDVTSKMDMDYGNAVTLAYQLGIMGQNMPGNKFRPNDTVTRAEFATALSRMLFNTKDGDTKYYTTHLEKLKELGIITNDNPSQLEKRGYVMKMLYNATKLS